MRRFCVPMSRRWPVKRWPGCVREWTVADFAAARPALEVVAELFGRPAADALRRGRPRKARCNVSTTLRLDEDVLAGYQLQGKGWQTRMNQVLRKGLQKDVLL